MLALGAGCASAQPPFAPMAIDLRVTHRVLANVENAETSPQSLHVQLLAVREPLAGPSLDASAAVITAARGAAFRGAGPLPATSVWLVGAAAHAAAGRLAAPDVARVVAAGVAIAGRDLLAVVATTATDLPTLRAQQGADGAIWLRVGRGDGDEPEVDVHVRDALASGDMAVLFVPAVTAGCAGHAFVLTIAPAGADAIAAARASNQLAAGDDWPRRWRIAFASVGLHNRRPPLLEIARTLGAMRARDLILIADEALLIEVSERLARELTPADADAPWPFERALWRAVLPRLERDELPDALYAACLRHLGAMADDTGALRSALDGSADAVAFVRAVREDNVGALTDRDAAWRTRGLDWLRRQGVAVPGYDPLADDAARRAALRAFLDAEAAAPAGR